MRLTILEWVCFLSLAITVVAAVCSVIGCTSAAQSQWGALGSNQRVTLYSGGQAVRVWTSNGKVMSETDSDGYYFMDGATGKLVRVTGDVVVETPPPPAEKE